MKVVETLLSRGHDPNHPNQWGKTPLMYAAQLNYFDSARALLRSGANVNATTNGSLRFAGRTALMYAAENSDIKMVRLLLSANADAEATDSQGNSVAAYLASNENIDLRDKLALFRDWRSKGKPSVFPGFDCDKTALSVEIALCSSAELAAIDNEMSTLYAKARSGKASEQLTSSQKAFLERRSTLCGVNKSSAIEFLGCLEDETRRRSTELTELLAEAPKAFPGETASEAR